MCAVNCLSEQRRCSDGAPARPSPLPAPKVNWQSLLPLTPPLLLMAHQGGVIKVLDAPVAAGNAAGVLARLA